MGVNKVGGAGSGRVPTTSLRADKERCSSRGHSWGVRFPGSRLARRRPMSMGALGSSARFEATVRPTAASSALTSLQKLQQLSARLPRDCVTSRGLPGGSDP